MSTTFSLPRTLRYTIAELRANVRIHLQQMGIVALTLLGSTLIYVLCNIGRPLNMVISSFYLSTMTMLYSAVALIVTIFIAGGMKKFHRVGSGPLALGIPVGRGEKFAAHAVINLILVPVVMFGIFFIFKGLTYLCIPSDQVMDSEFHIPLTSRWYFMFTGFVFYFFCSVRFRRSQFGYGVLTLFLLCVAVVIFVAVMNQLLPSSSLRALFETIEIAFDAPWHNITLSFMNIGLLFWSWRRFTKLRLKR